MKSTESFINETCEPLHFRFRVNAAKIIPNHAFTLRNRCCGSCFLAAAAASSLDGVLVTGRRRSAGNKDKREADRSMCCVFTSHCLEKTLSEEFLPKHHFCGISVMLERNKRDL